MAPYPTSGFQFGSVRMVEKLYDQNQFIEVRGTMKKALEGCLEKSMPKLYNCHVVSNFQPRIQYRSECFTSHTFSCECNNARNVKYRYSFDFLHNVREKMFEYACSNCHGFDARPVRRNFTYDSASLNGHRVNNNDPHLNTGRNHAKRPRNESPASLTKIRRTKPVTSPIENVDCEEIQTTNEFRLDGSMCKKTSDAAAFQFANGPEDRPPQSPTHEMWDKLSQSIWERFTRARQTEETFLKKMHLWHYLYKSIQKMSWLSKYELYLMGSTVSGFGMNDSDIDMCIVRKDGPIYCDPRTEALENLLHVKQFIESIAASNFDGIWLVRAKVPIIRFRYKKEDIDIDLSYNNIVGIRNTQLLHCYAQLDWRVRPLGLIVKLWAKHHNLNNPKHSTISSYSLVLMLIQFLQCGVSPPVLPCLHKIYPQKFSVHVQPDRSHVLERVEPFATENNDTLGSLFLHFLKYYSTFDYAHNAISVRTGTVIPVQECSWNRNSKPGKCDRNYLSIEEPFNLTNTGKSVHDGHVFEQIKSTFATSLSVLEDTQDVSNLFGERFFSPSVLSSSNGYF